MSEPGYLIGESLLGKIRGTVAKVEGAPVVGKVSRIQTRFEDQEDQPRKVFRIATFTGSWSIDSTKTVTLKYQTSTPNTFVVNNLFVDLPPEGPVAIAQEGTAWYAVEFLRDQGSVGFRIATFMGEWNINDTKVVNYKYSPSGTVAVTNLFWPLPDSGERDCAIAKDGTAWFLVTPRLYSTNAAFTAELTTTELKFTTLPFPALGTAQTSQFSINVDQCPTATAT